MNILCPVCDKMYTYCVRDGGVDILPIADLYKKDVRKLAKHLGIPKRIITKPPSAGLWESQEDEKEMGITYKEVDDILEKYENGTKSPHGRKLNKKEEKVFKMIENTKHKRELPPICKIK